MALPKSMRYLAAATLCIFVYLFVQLLHSPQTELLIPNNKPSTQHVHGDRDPLLDRKPAPASTRPCSILTICSVR
jgi:mannosyltransferase